MKYILSLVAILLLGVTVYASSVTLAWDPNVEPDLAGYTVYWGPSPGYHTNHAYVGNVTICTLSSFVDGTYYFVVTASNTSGLESLPSNEISCTFPFVPRMTGMRVTH